MDSSIWIWDQDITFRSAVSAFTAPKHGAHEVFDQWPVPVPIEEAVRDLLAREILHIQNRLQQQEYSLQFIQGEVANLSNIVAQIGISLGMQHIQDGTNFFQASGFAIQQDVQFSEMPIWDVNDEDTDDLSKNEIPSPPSPMFASATDQTQYQTFETMPVFDVYDEETEGELNEHVDVFASNPGKQPYEEDQQDSEQSLMCFSKALKTEQAFACLNYISDLFDCTLEQHQQNDETTSVNVQQLRAPPLDVLVLHERRKKWDPGVKISFYSWLNIVTVWSENDKPLSCTHVPGLAAWQNQSVASGALLPLMSSKAQHSRQALQPAPFSQVFQFGVPTHVPRYIKFTHGQCIQEIVVSDLAPGYAMGDVQHMKAYKWNMVLGEEGREVWDPEASAFVVTPLKIDSSNYFSSHDKADIWSQSEYYFIVLRGVFEEVMRDKPPAKPPDRFGIADSSLQVILLKAQESENSSAHTLFNFLSRNPLWRNTTQLADKIFWHLYIVANLQNLFRSISSGDTENICTFLKWWPGSILSAQHFLEKYMSADTTICMILLLSSAEITQEGRDEAAVYKALILQLPMSTNSDVWDPGVKISLYNGLNILTIWAATDKQLYCTHIPELEARENAMHYCQMFEKCIGVSSQLYWHEDINLCGISLWLIHFLPP